ncbi:hypothetical protein [Paraburkholderia susongensis]|uniref:hypothetical protein n=1 Tax=Paraburkholderia susongensis TaxID=1515439 RepID=UPI000A1CD356|nr:hypothetical protein [Paraburkholderia susongensis]
MTNHIDINELNLLRHRRFLRDRPSLERLMDRHRELLAPRFGLVKTIFRNVFRGRDDRYYAFTIDTESPT